jgi:hypothetical protein
VSGCASSNSGLALVLTFLLPFAAAEDGPAVSLVPRLLEACSGAVGTTLIAPRPARRRCSCRRRRPYRGGDVCDVVLDIEMWQRERSQ